MHFFSKLGVSTTGSLGALGWQFAIPGIAYYEKIYGLGICQGKKIRHKPWAPTRSKVSFFSSGSTLDALRKDFLGLL